MRSKMISPFVFVFALLLAHSVFGQATTPPPGTGGGGGGAQPPMMTPKVWEGILPPAPWAAQYSKAKVETVNGVTNATLANRGMIRHAQAHGWFRISFIWTP